MNTDHVKDMLERLGYRVVFRENLWTECLVVTDGEVWNGRGMDKTGSLRDVVRRMFPSAASISLLSRALAETTSVPLGPASHEAEIVEPQPVQTEDVDLVVPDHAEPVELMDLVPVAAPEPEETVPEISRPESTTLQEENEPEIVMTPAEGLEIVREIAREIEDERGDLALMTTSDQRLHIGAWIFRARAVQEKLLSRPEIEEAVHKIALRLTVLCKQFWPGSVRALQVYTTPTQGLDGLVSRKMARSWSDAAQIIEQEIEMVAAQPGRDEYGWCDSASLVPASPDPGAVLVEAVAKIEILVGPVSMSADERERWTNRTRIVRGVDQLIRAAHLLRWTRKVTTDRHTWGLAMGALRWASRMIGETHNATLRSVLSDGFKPPRPWAEVLGRDPVINERARLQREVMQRTPSSGWPQETLLEWLHMAFQVFTNPQIAKLVSQAREDVLGLTSEDFADADRNTRSRLRRLQAILREQQDVSRIELPPLSASDEAVDVAPRRKIVDPAEALLERVREVTEGKRILFVGNREDELLRERLEKDLRCSVTVRDGGNPKRMRAILSAVTPSAYDFVLMATGFNNHVADATLCRQAKACGIPYVRVSKGRPLATVRALARVLNLDHGHGAVTSLSRRQIARSSRRDLPEPA